MKKCQGSQTRYRFPASADTSNRFDTMLTALLAVK